VGFARLGKGDDSARQLYRDPLTAAGDAKRTLFEADHQIASNTLGLFAIARQHRNDRAVALRGNQRPRRQRLLDVLGDLSGQLVACVQAELQLLPAKVDDAEYEHALVTVCVALAGEVLLRAGDRLPHGVLPLAKGVVAAKRP